MLATRTVHVLFDTNPIYVESDSELLSATVREYISSSGGDADFAFRWVLPEGVIEERCYRMTQMAMGRLGAVRRLERVLGRSLDVSEDKIAQGVRERIAQACATCGIERLPLDCSAVDWQVLVAAAMLRRPPFEDGEDGKKEKGFRDAIIGESFLQYIASIGDDSTRDVVVIVTSDARLTEMLEERTRERRNVHLSASLDALKGQVEEARAGISAEVAERIREHASSFFSGAPTSMWTQSDIFTLATEAALPLLAERPKGAYRTDINGIAVRPARFVDRAGREVMWESIVAIEVTAWRKQHTSFIPTLASDWTTFLAPQGGAGQAPGINPLVLPKPHNPHAAAFQWKTVLSTLKQAPLNVPAAALPDLLVGRRTVSIAIRWKAVLENDVLQPDGEIISVTPSAESWASARR